MQLLIGYFEMLAGFKLIIVQWMLACLYKFSCGLV